MPASVEQRGGFGRVGPAWSPCGDQPASQIRRHFGVTQDPSRNRLSRDYQQKRAGGHRIAPLHRGNRRSPPRFRQRHEGRSRRRARGCLERKGFRGGLPKYSYQIRLANLGNAPITLYKWYHSLQFPWFTDAEGNVVRFPEGGVEFTFKPDRAIQANNPKLPLRLEPADVFFFRFGAELTGWTYPFKDQQEYPAHCRVSANTTAGDVTHDQYVQLIYGEMLRKSAPPVLKQEPLPVGPRPRIGPKP
jgi:hypothetical protein